jgi:hypothetical protein
VILGLSFTTLAVLGWQCYTWNLDPVWLVTPLAFVSFSLPIEHSLISRGNNQSMALLRKVCSDVSSQQSGISFHYREVCKDVKAYIEGRTF